MKLRRIAVAGLLGLACAAGAAAGPAHASDGANAVPAPQLRQNGGITSYVDNIGVTHLLADVYNTGATVESGAAILDLEDSSGNTIERDQAYVPVGWLEKGEYAPIDFYIEKGALIGGKPFTGKWKIERFVGYPNQVVPTHAFTVSDIVTSSTAASVLTGTIRNDNSYPVNLIKVSASFFDTSGNIVYAEPTDVNSNDDFIPAGATYSFALPKQTGIPSFDPSNYKLIVESNEPGAPLPVKNSPSQVGPTTATVTFPHIPLYTLNRSEHFPVVNGSTAGVPNPTASDLAGAANPPTVVRQHDQAAVNTNSDTAQALVNQSAPEAPHSSSWVPILLIIVLGGYGLFATVGNARLGLARFVEKRREHREALAALAPGAVSGYGAMRGRGQ